MSKLAGAYYEVGFQIRPLTVVTVSNEQQEPFIGETTATVFGVHDFVTQEAADTLKSIWIKSLHERKATPFRDLSDNATPEDRVLLAAAIAADKIDRSIEHLRVAQMDMAIPSRFSVNLHPTDGMLRLETLETLVPFQRIQEILIQRERNMSQEPLGHISFTATRIETGPEARMN